VQQFEKAWSDFLNVKHSVFVNSGSSALLLAYYLYKLKNPENKKIVVPGLSWATDLAPVLQFDLEPILCDCNLNDLSLDLDHLESILQEHNPGMVNVVSVLGLVPDMQRLIELKNKYQFMLLEDVCESFGSKYNDQLLGSFGDMSVFSLYYGHHLSTIEGGMICTNDTETYHLLLMLRSHGWDRELPEENQQLLRTQYGCNNFSAAYTFYYPGFNVRPTDLQAKIGLMQLDDAQFVIEQRNKNFNYLLDNIKCNWLPSLKSTDYVSNFCFPIISNDKEKIIENLLNNNIEVRPLICGSMGRQPFYKNVYGEKYLKNCDTVDRLGMYIPNNPDLTTQELDRMIDCINLTS
jgi:CDP-6-deoxy-D-xylo-4-hexulose-3-dehydrase